ncbi:MAG: hypothetical protein PHY64_07250, partial [Eubacteriales bacterium]|nr:hypothetical protein [Eubacteriales bacterium]
AADTYLPDGEVTHADFTLGLSLHADGFPQGRAHLSDWEAFLNKLDLRGSIDSLALFQPYARTYLNGALRLNGKDQIPFVYDAYHSYRYLITPALANEPMFFQMHNFLEFMLKPYYYMELPTQYLALLLYPDAAYWIGDSYYEPIREAFENAREAALTGETPTVDETAGETTEETAPEGSDSTADTAAAADADSAETATPDEFQVQPEAGDVAIIGGADGPTQIYIAPGAEDGALTYTIPYEDLYELCENLDLVVNDDVDLDRAYFFFTCLLTEMYASDMTLDILGNLENELDTADPDESDLIVTETADSMTATLNGVELFRKTTTDGVTAFTLTLPTSAGYVLTFDYRWDPTAETGAALSAKLNVTIDGETAVELAADGTGLPREGDLGGQGSLTLTASGYTFENEIPPLMFNFDWARDAAVKPYTLALNIDWIHPETLKPAISLHFNGTLSTVDKSVFTDGQYPQNDFFNLNETFLDDYKAELMPSLILKLAPIVLNTPAGVIDDIYRFTKETDILVSFVE